jgi:hypothetical protein
LLAIGFERFTAPKSMPDEMMREEAVPDDGQTANRTEPNRQTNQPRRTYRDPPAEKATINGQAVLWASSPIFQPIEIVLVLPGRLRHFVVGVIFGGGKHALSSSSFARKQAAPWLSM